MATKIPNDIYQFSLKSALDEGLNVVGPKVAALKDYGTDGIGVFSHLEGELLFFNNAGYHIKPHSSIDSPCDGTACTTNAACCLVERAVPDAQLPFVMVVKFVPEFGLVSNGEMEMEALTKVITAEGPKAGGKNSFIPFKIRGDFDSVSLDDHVLRNVSGSVFGIICPDWAGTMGMTFTGTYCHFLSERDGQGRLKGGRVQDYKSKGTSELSIDWAVSKHFHLGFPPPSDAWESLKLTKAAEAKAKALINKEMEAQLDVKVDERAQAIINQKVDEKTKEIIQKAQQLAMSE